MKRSLNFSKKNSSKSIQLNSETSFIKFLRLIVENNDEIDCDGDIITAKLKCFSKDTDNEITLEFKKESSYYKLASTIPDLKDTHTVLLSFDFSDIKGCELKLVYDDVDYKLPIEATKEFNDHINNELNKKIFFSAPFGKGKSTFLEYFFEDKKEDYEVFKVFPINYSIASNKDIFKYIKVDVLLQLISKGVTFEKEVFSNLLLAQQFAINNSKSIIKSLLEIGLSLNKETAPLTKVFDGVNTLFEKFDDFQKKSQIDDFKKAKDYIGQLYDDEASLFEDNYYTQLVRQLIEQLKIENNKKTVLVIDDLDRMDPEHIFRILNVISAHYDSYMLEDNKEYCNKFGFDKIILVADINNIKSIYEHRFGENVDFDGYINKFYSNNIFKFDSKKVGQILLGELNNKYRNNNYASSLRILNIFNSLELLSLRQIIKLSNDFSFSDIPFTRDRIFDGLRFFRLGLYTPILDALTDVFHSKENFIKIINFNVRNSRIKTDESIDFICKHLLASITSTFSDKIGHYKLNNKELEFNHKDDFATEGFKAEEIKQITDDGQKEDFTGFTWDNLSDLLIENIKHL